MMEPMVSICIPSLGRKDKLERCLASIAVNTDWPHEVIVREDEFGPGRKGCPKTLAACVDDSQGEFVAFLGNDCWVGPGWLRCAMRCMQESFPQMDGIVGCQDDFWPERPLHFVASKKLLPLLGGEFFCTAYHHVGVDDELFARCRKLGRYVFCPEAKVSHDHFSTGAAFDEVYALAWDANSIAEDRELLGQRSQRLDFADYLIR